MRRFLVTLCAALALTAVAGCGPRKGVVYGVVTLDGKPLEVDDGDIQFFPVDGDAPTKGGKLNRDGSYRITDVTPTKMKVVINASKVVGHRKRYENVPDSPMDEIWDAVLPPRYCDRNKTELSFTVVPGDNKMDFDLTSDSKKDR
jgi:hypothetical protein